MTLVVSLSACSLFVFNDTATTEIYTLSLHDALPISPLPGITTLKPGSATQPFPTVDAAVYNNEGETVPPGGNGWVTEIGRVHAELQSLTNLVCRLLLEKKKKNIKKEQKKDHNNNKIT